MSKLKTIKRAKWWCDCCDGAIVAVGKKCPRCGRKNRQMKPGRLDKSEKMEYNKVNEE
jgi:Zn finger protein HypA/HybF involved in hydrogenase expression